MANVEKIIAQTFMDIATGLETGSFSSRPRIAVTGLGSEHGEANAVEACLLAADRGVDVTLIGTAESDKFNTCKVSDEDEMYKEMEKLLDSGAIDGCVTMHYPFPIGVSTVGRVVTPGKGKQMYIATTTGTSSAERIEAMIKNAIYGIITAKACGIKEPTVGILNVDGARQCEGALKELQANGYDIHFAESSRADGGCVMRGNDMLVGACDVMVTDSLTGNILMKMMSSYTPGGSYEAMGYGYGPGIGEGYERLVLIVSRASGAPVLANAMEYASQLVKGNYKEIAKKEFAAAHKAGLNKVIEARKPKKAAAEDTAEVVAPPKEVVTSQLSGIEIMDLEDAVKALWKVGVYAESGMGCTGPIILVSEANHDKAAEALKAAGYIQ